MAFDAKDCGEKRIALDRLAPHQIEHLEAIAQRGALAFVLVRFERKRVYMIPVEAWRWAVEAHRAAHEVWVEELQWTATGKASISEKDLPERWRVDGYDWAKAFEGHDSI